MYELARTIQQRMDELGMSQADLARKTGLTTANVAYIVNGKTKDPRLSSVVVIAKALDMSLDELVGY